MSFCCKGANKIVAQVFFNGTLPFENQEVTKAWYVGTSQELDGTVHDDDPGSNDVASSSS